MKCEQCGFLVDSLPEGGGEYLCPNCGWVMRKGPPAVPDAGQPSPTDTATNTHLKIAKTVNIGFGDFAATTLPGRAISVILGLYGIIVVALITSIIVNFYNETKNTADPDETETAGQ